MSPGKDSGSSFVLGLYLLLICTSLGLMIFTNNTILSGGNSNMNNEFEAKMFAESALKMVSGYVGSSRVRYERSMSLQQLEGSAREAGLGTFAQYLAHALEKRNDDPGTDYSIPFLMGLQQHKVMVKLEFILLSESLDIIVLVKEVEIRGDKVSYTGYRSLTFSATVEHDSADPEDMLIIYDGGRYE